tara:strand:- start:989 stop:1765 length:777 start_codon:yes stop_codon:yes gene_type:complete
MALSWNDMKMFLPPELKAGVSLAEGEDPMAVMANYTIGQGIDYGVSSGADAVGGVTDNVDAATEQFKQAGLVSPGATDSLTQNVSAPVVDAQVSAPVVDAPTFQPGDLGPEMPQYPKPTIQNSGLQDSGIVGQGGQVKLGDNAVTGPQFDNYPTTSPANLPEPEAPGTFLGLEGKDYTKMGMQGVLAAGVSAAQPTPIQPSKAPAGPGMTKGNPIPQGGAVGVNSMVNPVQPLNSMQMTQAQGLISPFQRDRMRRGQY